MIITHQQHSKNIQMWNFKTLKIQKMFQNCLTILKLQESFTTYKWVIMYMMYEKSYSLEYNKAKERENLSFGDDLKF
jgi:hypothetical protein